MITWIHKLTKIGENGVEETVYIPDAEFAKNWEDGDPAGYRNKEKYKDWSVKKYWIPQELYAGVTLDDRTVVYPEGMGEGKKCRYLADVLAPDEDGDLAVKFGRKVWKLIPTVPASLKDLDECE